MSKPQYGTVEIKAITGKFHGSELSYVSVNYEVRHRAESTSLEDLESIFNSKAEHSGKRNFRLEAQGENGPYHVIEEYTVVRPIDDAARQLFLSLV